MWGELGRCFPSKICITLRESPERTAAARKQFDARGWQVPFFVAERDQSDPGRGCFNSHVACMKRALANPRVHYALVLEDDVSFERAPSKTELRHLKKLLRAPDTWDCIMLGWCGADYAPKQCLSFKSVAGLPSLYTSDCRCTHAIVYSRQFMRRFVETYPVYPNLEIDDVFFEMRPHLRQVAFKPPLFGQDAELTSTIDDPNIERKVEPFASASRSLHGLCLVVLACACLVLALAWQQQKKKR